MTPDHKSLEWAHPLVREWFYTKVGRPSKPQIEAWPSIAAHKSTLISAPTGSGKTLAAFLSSINDLCVQALKGKLLDELKVIYVSPLKALSNDVQKNLITPLEEIGELARAQGLSLGTIKVGLRTGDTPAHMRASMLKKPPHILVTTPESLYILLTAQKSRVVLRSVHTVIVDEIHALAKDKRGVHLALSLERLEALAQKPLTRIGLSATQKPIEEVAKFLVGSKRALPSIIDIGHDRPRELRIEVPTEPLSAVATNEMWGEIYDRLSALAREHRSMLIFTNTRRLSERIAHHLSERLGEEQVAAHHGSLSRTLRLDVETKLKAGKLKALVATASLELGIDIGELDLVCQVGSPRSIAVALQRVGRSGHWHGGISRGRFFATTRDELLECAALVKAIETGVLDTLIMPKNSLDILAQQLIACAVSESYSEQGLFELVKGAYPYADLSLETFKKVLHMLTDGIAGTRGRYSAYLFHDKVNDLISARKHSRLVALSNGGAIADNGLFSVIAEPGDMTVGTLDEDFAIESHKGDIILLGTSSWRINRIEASAGKVVVEDARGMPPNVPFWRGEAPGRTDELSAAVSDLRYELAERLPLYMSADTVLADSNFNDAIRWLIEQCHLEAPGALQLAEYLFQGRAVLGAVPTKQTIIAERFFDEGGGMQLIIHAPFGARINKAWGLALRKKFCRSFNFELQASATDNGINIALLEQHSFPLEDVFKFLHPNTIKAVLVQAVLQSPLFATRWRFVAQRSLALVKWRNGKKVQPFILRMLSDDLLASVFPDAAACQDNLGGKELEPPDHPLINEAMGEIFNEVLDDQGLLQLLTDLLDASIRVIAIDTPMPSVFAHEILNANPYAFLDDAPLEERRARAVELRRMLPNTVLSEIGALDSEVIKQVKAQAWPDIRDANELHDYLQTLLAIPKHALDKVSELHVAELLQSKRATWGTFGTTELLLAAEKQQTFLCLYPEAKLEAELMRFDEKPLERDEALFSMLRNYMQCLGPTTSAALTTLVALPINDIERALLKLESEGLILRGNFTGEHELEWCERRLLARIHRMTVEKLRQQIKASTPAQFLAWLARFQHRALGSKLKGKRGLLEIIGQLQGFELPARLWEQEVFKQCMLDYDGDMLDQLGLKGIIGWGRLSPHKALMPDAQKHVIARSTAPITFFIREEALWLKKPLLDENELSGLSALSLLIYAFLKKNGASFFHDIVRGVQKLAYEVENALWQLLSAGLVTADDFDNLRALISAKRRQRQGLRMSTGRWSILSHESDEDQLVESAARLLLRRYGIVFRDLLKREKNMPAWRELLRCFRRLEDRGEIRGGRFVSGFAGEQFALPMASEALRAFGQQAQRGLVVSTLPASDPLKLAGIIMPEL